MKHNRARWLLTGVCLVMAGTILGAAEPLEQLAERERAVSRQMRELEATFLRLADLLATTDPRRAATLRGGL